jgi:hypothetical protein
MKRLTLLSMLAVLAFPVEGLAQVGGAPNMGGAGRQPEGGMLTRDTMSQSDLKIIAEQIDQWNRVDGKAGVTPRVARARTTAMLGVLKVSCAVAEATYRGPAPDAGAQHVYEAACEDGMGYLLKIHGSALTGVSCLAAGREESPLKCALPANTDGKIMAGKVLNGHRIPCTVLDLKWLGTNVASLDHIEVACEGGGGYVMRSPPLGAGGELQVISCQDALKSHVACELSPQAAPATTPAADSRPTLAWFKEALNRNGVSCESKRARIVGRESIKRRYLVEFECADHPEGLVAFVPPAGDTVNSFESMNCPSAAKQGVLCMWAAKY